MIRINDDAFKTTEPIMDNVIAIRIQESNMYF